MPIVSDLNDLELLLHTKFMPILERASVQGDLPVVFEKYEVVSTDEDFLGKDALLGEIREEFVDGMAASGADGRVCGLIMMTSASPIVVDPPRDDHISHAITLSLLAPLTWRPRPSMDGVSECTFQVYEHDAAIGETMSTMDIRDRLEALVPEGMTLYGPMIISSDDEITIYLGGVDGPDEDFGSVGRRMLVTLVVQETGRHRDEQTRLTTALIEYAAGQCELCPDMDRCEEYAEFSRTFPRDDPEAMASVIMMAAAAMARLTDGSTEEIPDVGPMDDDDEDI